MVPVPDNTAEPENKSSFNCPRSSSHLPKSQGSAVKAALKVSKRLLALSAPPMAEAFPHPGTFPGADTESTVAWAKFSEKSMAYWWWRKFRVIGSISPYNIVYLGGGFSPTCLMALGWWIPRVADQVQINYTLARKLPKTEKWQRKLSSQVIQAVTFLSLIERGHLTITKRSQRIPRCSFSTGKLDLQMLVFYTVMLVFGGAHSPFHQELGKWRLLIKINSTTKTRRIFWYIGPNPTKGKYHLPTIHFEEVNKLFSVLLDPSMQYEAFD